jgi:predicted Zn-dependent protease
VLQRSPADETELVWLEVDRGQAQNRNKQVEHRTRLERTILVRVIDRRRVGSHRTGVANIGELEGAIRFAMAQSRSREPLPGMLHLPADEASAEISAKLWDPKIATLDRDRLKAIYRPWLGQRGTMQLHWAKAHVAVFNSRGIRRQAAVTAVGGDARIGRRPGGGHAAGAARTLEGLAAEQIFEQARQRHATGPVADLPDSAVTLVLSPEATTQLCDILNRVALSAVAYYHGSSFLREHLDVQVFDRSFNLRDDGTDPLGLSFPFDLEGTPKRPVNLIHKGTAKTPALDQRQAAQLGLTPTAHAIGGNDSRAMNLFLEPGELTDEELLQTASDGIWIGWLDEVECFEPARVQIRASGRGVRRIASGQLAEGLPDLVWEDSLLRALANLPGVGAATVQRLSHDGFLGGTSAPSLVITGVSGLRTAE